jgi:hypothetical protein
MDCRQIRVADTWWVQLANATQLNWLSLQRSETANSVMLHSNLNSPFDCSKGDSHE